MFLEHEEIKGGLIRVKFSEEGKDYKFSVTYDNQTPWAVIKGFYHKGALPSEFRNVTRMINERTGKLVAYERQDDVQALVYQIDPALCNGRIYYMTKIHHTDEAKHGGKVVTQTALEHAEEAIAVIRREGHIIVTMGETEVVNPQDLPDLDDLLDNDLLEPGDKVYIFVRRAPK